MSPSSRILPSPGRPKTISAFANTAVEAGCRGNIVLLSGRGEDGAVLSENELKAVGVDCTVLRASWFNREFQRGRLSGRASPGKLALPVGDVPEPFVDADDLADVAVEGSYEILAIATKPMG